MPSGTATVDFGAFPGKSDASVDVVGQSSILSGSLVEAWIRPGTTSDHTHDEHLVETIKVIAGNIVAGTGFTIYAVNTSEINEPSPAPRTERADAKGTRIYGQWSVAWVWQ